MQKLRIAVCEDEKTQIDYLCRKLEKYEAENEVRLDIDCYFSASSFYLKKKIKRSTIFSFLTSS